LSLRQRQLLRKRYINASHQDAPFPGYTLGATRIRSAILLTIKEWIVQGDGSQDILDDSQLFDALWTFLKSPPHPSPAASLEPEEQSSEDLDQIRNSLLAVINSHIQRPPIRSNPITKLSSNGTGFGRDPPDIDLITAEQLVDNFDAIASAAFSSINEEVTFLTFVALYCVEFVF
jgi:GTPase-activating protein BEM2